MCSRKSHGENSQHATQRINNAMHCSATQRIDNAMHCSATQRIENAVHCSATQRINNAVHCRWNWCRDDVCVCGGWGGGFQTHSNHVGSWGWRDTWEMIQSRWYNRDDSLVRSWEILRRGWEWGWGVHTHSDDLGSWVSLLVLHAIDPVGCNVD